MRNDEQGRIAAGDAREPYERPELRELSVSETLGGFVQNEPESSTFTNPNTGTTATGDGFNAS
jgi:hypothetical protein